MPSNILSPKEEASSSGSRGVLQRGHNIGHQTECWGPTPELLNVTIRSIRWNSKGSEGISAESEDDER
ncbi:hypothetical protein F3Y22_tig00110356pilonHSYRG00092 [Hibiscus syriacus]|uniref:Uncharacterized protein n=1 Tax=Hibiscus syriacus TaxID=106335 RepID=A0A6A3ATT0_HIBSY|nr:hypothetical protein F3Y22_tig00110356pilonHSYRG00092 [Hibiscus syriacus]